MFSVIKIIMLSLFFSSVVLADDDWDDHRGSGPEYYPAYYQPAAPGYYLEEIVYVPERVVEYVPVQSSYYGPVTVTINVRRKAYLAVLRALGSVIEDIKQQLDLDRV